MNKVTKGLFRGILKQDMFKKSNLNIHKRIILGLLACLLRALLNGKGL